MFLCDFSFRMAESKGRIIKEIVLSTRYNCTRNGACLDFTLNQELSFEGMGKIHVGLTNLVMPPKKKSMDIKLFFSHVLEKFEESRLKLFTLNYSSYEDLCTQIQCCALEFLTVERHILLDFRSANATSQKNFYLSVRYSGNRIIIEQDIDFILVISSNFGDLIEFGNVEKKEISGVNYCFISGVMHVSRILRFEDEKDYVLHFIAYELIESCTRLSNGNHIPLLYTYDRQKGEDNIDTVRLVSLRYFRSLKVIVMNNNFERYDFTDYDFVNGELRFSLIFFL